MSELDFNFDIPKIKTTAEKKLERADAAELCRFKNRTEAADKVQRAQYRKSLPGRLQRVWDDAWQKLAPEEQAVVEAQNANFRLYWSMIQDCLQNITQNLDLAPYPNLSLQEIQEFIADMPLSKVGWPDIDVAARLDGPDFDNLDDDTFRLYGRPSKLPAALYSNFVACVRRWAIRNPDDCLLEMPKQLAIPGELAVQPGVAATPAAISKADWSGDE